MDERQAQIKEGAGLEESRVNQELLDFLQKWSTPVLLVIAIISGSYFLYNQYQVRQIRKKDDAFAQLGNIESSASPSPFSLTAIADEFDGVASVSELALLRAAEIHLNAVRSGIDPTAEDITAEEAQLSEEDIAFHREQAGTYYQRVADRVAGDAGRGLFAINAAFGLAAVAESAGDLELARERYTKAESLATEHGFTPLATVAADLGSSVGEAGDVTLYEREDLPRMPFEPEPLESSIEVIDDAVGPEAGPETDPENGSEVGPEAAADAETPDSAPADDEPAEGDGSGDGEPSDG